MNINKGLCFRLLAVILTFAMVFGMIPMAFASNVVNEPYTFIVKSNKTAVNMDDILTLEIIAKGSMVNANILQFTLNYAAADFSYSAVENDWNSMIKAGSEWGVISTTPVGKESTNKSDSTKKYIRIGYVSMADAYINEDNNEELCSKKEAVVAKIEFKANQKIDDISECFSVSSAKNGFLGESGDQLNSTTGHVYVQLSDTIKAKEVYDMIDNLPDTISYADKSAVEAARIAYNNLGNETYADILKGLVTNYATLQAAEATIATIEANIKGFKDAVTALKAVDLNTYKYDPEDDNLGTLIAAANTEYAKVESANLQSEVTAEKADLDDINTTYKNHEAAYKEANKADGVNDKIKAIGKVVYTDASLDLIDKANSAYVDYVTKYTEAIGSMYADYITLSNAGDTYAALKVEVEGLIGKVNSLPEAADLTLKSLENENITTPLTEAWTLYNSNEETFTPEQKAAFEANDEGKTVAKLKACYDAYTKLLEKQTRINNVITAINNIPAYNSIALSDAAENGTITIARNAYDALTSQDEKDAIDNIDTLIAAERKIEYLELAAGIDDLIGRIGTVSYPTPDSGDAIDAARAEYNKYVEPQDARYKEVLDYVTKYDILVKAEADYTDLVDAENLRRAEEVSGHINAIPELIVENYTAIGEKLAIARASYSLLDETQLKLLSDADKKKLDDAEATYPLLGKAKDVYDLIENLGDISINSGAAIDAAEEAYAELGDDTADPNDDEVIQGYVSNYQKLADARTKYDKIVEADKLSKEIEEFLEKAFAYTDEYLSQLSDLEARLTDDLKEFVGDSLETGLTNARNTYNTKENEFNTTLGEISSLLDSVQGMLTNAEKTLSDITLADEDIVDAIVDAHEKYTALPEKAQENLSQEDVEYLDDAWNKYLDLEKGAEEVANEIIKAINAISDVNTLTLGDADRIAGIRDKYKTNPASHEYIDAYIEETGEDVLEKLEAAENKISQLRADKKAVEEMTSLIKSLFPVVDGDEFADKLTEVKAKFEAFSEDDSTKHLVDQVLNKGDIEKAENQYNKLKEVKKAIEELPEAIEYSTECNELIAKAEQAYKELDELDGTENDLIAQVDGDAITAAREAYDQKKPTGSMVFVPEYGDRYMAVYNNIPANRKVTLEGIEAGMFELEGNVYYVILSKENLDITKVVISEDAEPSKLHIMGDVLVDEEAEISVTSRDALPANQLAARLEVDIFEIDPMAYVRADVNGTGDFTALDALAVAKIANGEEVKYNLYTGYIIPTPSE